MIKIDLPMPEACDVCPLNYDFIGCRGMNEEDLDKYGDDWNLHVCEGERRPEYCPLKELKDQPQIVRCKDCQWFNQPFENEGMCIKHDHDFHKLDWFCADGERRSEP